MVLPSACEVSDAEIRTTTCTESWSLGAIKKGLVYYMALNSATGKEPNEESRQLTRRREDEESEDSKRKLDLTKAGGVAAAVASIIAFLLTEDLTAKMIFADNWSVLMVILTAIQIGTAVRVNKMTDSDDREEK